VKNHWTDYDHQLMTNTITGRMMKCMEELVQYQVDLLINEENEWFMEILDRKLEERWVVEFPQFHKEKNNG
tara:strand:+ start:1397 stop:1609 length:213 start_codon:yes stop_codon:yes gene_type:complete